MMHKFIGRFSLVKHGTFDLAGSYHPTSDYLKGEITYANDGSLSVLILFKEVIESQKDILSYVGTYEVVSDEVLFHHISLCSNQTRNNSSEKRTYLFSGDTLVLGCEMANGFRFEATWIRSVH